MMPKFGNSNGNAEKTKDQLYLHFQKNTKSQALQFYNKIQ